MDAVEVGKNLLMEAGPFLINADGAVAFGLGALVLVGTAGTVLALVKFLYPAAVVLDRHGIAEKRISCRSGRADCCVHRL